MSIFNLALQWDSAQGPGDSPGLFRFTDAEGVLPLKEGAQQTKPIPRWDVHFGGPDEDRKNATAPHITFRPRLGGYRQCGLAICRFHLGLSLDISFSFLRYSEELYTQNSTSG